MKKSIKHKIPKSKNNHLTITYKNYKLTLGPGESEDLINMMQKQWPLQPRLNQAWIENTDIAKFKDLKDGKENIYVIENTPMTIKEIEKEFGTSIKKFKKSVSR